MVVIGGGLTGLETAELIASWGNKVTVTSRGEILAPNEWRQHVLDSVERLKKHDVRIMTTQTPIKINNRAVKFINSKSKEPMQLPADVVVVAGGVKPENKLYDELKGVFERTYIVGDALESGYIVDATHSAFKIARSL